MRTHFGAIWEAIADAVPRAGGCRAGGSARDVAATTSNAPPGWRRRCSMPGVGPGSKVGMYLYNSPEYCETNFAAMKVRGVPINVNYRYLDDELHYLLDNADIEALVFHTSLGDRVARGARPAGPGAAPCRGGRRRRARRDDPRRAAPSRYEDLQATVAPAHAHRTARRRALHLLHRWNDGHAQGRHVPA